MKRQLFRILFLLILCMTLLPGRANAATHTLENGGDLRALLSGDRVQNGDTVQLLGTAYVNDPLSDSAPWIIAKSVTLRGGSIDLRSGGILLGADVTLDAVELCFANNVRNAIIANGHTLTLKDVTQSSSTKPVHLFCGSLTGHDAAAASGSHGQVVIQGSTTLGNLYAGSLSADGAENSFSHPVTITLGGSGKVGSIYGCGAVETYVDSSKWFDTGYVPEPPAASAEHYSVTGSVTVNLNDAPTVTVFGEAGENNLAAVKISGGAGYAATHRFSRIGNLVLEEGVTYLPPADSDLTKTQVTVSADARLDLTERKDWAVAALKGSGILVLDSSGSLEISGAVENGPLSVAIGGTDALGTVSTASPADSSHTYILAAESAPEDFVLLPCPDGTGALIRDAFGHWTAAAAEDAVKADAFSFTEEAKTLPHAISINLPIAVTYSGDAWAEVYMLYPTLRINGAEVPLVDPDYWEFGNENLSMYFTSDGLTEFLYIGAAPGLEAIPEGIYEIAATIPAAYSSSGEALTAVITLTIGDPQPDVTEPTAPQETEPEVTEPEETKPAATEPEETQPVVTEPEETQPAVTEPKETQPVATEPEETKPAAIEPEETQPVVPPCNGGESCILASFGDIDPSQWYHDGIHFCVEKGLMNGVGNGCFAPSGTTSRAMIVTILWRMEGKPRPRGSVSFADVVPESWYAEAVSWAAGEKIVEGYGDTFGPDDAITREQFATILYRYAQRKGCDTGIGKQTDISGYGDAGSVSSWARDAMQWACGAGLMQGDGVSLTPLADATRAQAAALFQRFCTNIATK